MEIIAILFGLGVLGATIVVPIVAIVSAFRTSKLTREVRATLELVRHRLGLTEQRLARLEQRLQQLQAAAQTGTRIADESTATLVEAVPEATVPPSIAASPVGEPEPDDVPARLDDSAPARQLEAEARVDSDISVVQTAASERETASATPPVATSTEGDSAPPKVEQRPTATHEERRRAPAAANAEPASRATPTNDGARPNRPPTQQNWEGIIGVRLFSWLGGGALFLGAALFLHYSIEQNLISPPVRVALGLLAGALLLVLGERVRAKAGMASQAIMGAGVGTLYASLYASRSLYHLLPTPAAFAGMVLVTITAGVLATRRSAYLLAVLGLVGGMATPFLLSTGEDRPWSLFAYVVLLDLGIVWVSRKRAWPTLALLGFCASVLVFAAWCSEYLYSSRVPYALAALGVVAAVFASMIRFKRQGTPEVPPTVRVLVEFAMVTPLVVALVLVCHPKMHVGPAFLTAYIALITFGASVVAGELRAPYVPLVAVAMCVLTQALRTQGDLFPVHAWATLGSYSILPLSQTAITVWKRRSRLAKVHAWSLGVALASPCVLVPIAGELQPPAGHLALAVYTAVHVLGLLALACAVAEPKFLAVGQLVVLVVAASLRGSGGPEITAPWSVWMATSALTFFALPMLASSVNRTLFALAVSAVSLPLHFALLYVATHTLWESGPLGLTSVMCGLSMVIGLRHLRPLPLENDRSRTAAMALHSAFCLAFVTTALSILLENQWLTVALALEVAALAWLRRRVAHDGLVLAASVLAAAVVARLLFNPWLWEYQPRTGLPILNFYLYTFLVVAAAFVYAARLLEGNAFALEYKFCPMLKSAAIVLLFVLVNIEVADDFSTGSSLVFRFSGGGLGQDMAYSLSWGSFALILMVIGIVKRTTSLRIWALLFLCLTIGKVFLHDLWQLGALYRVGSVVGLAVALLLVSYLVQRFIFRGAKS